jgi:hypothetical protein
MIRLLEPYHPKAAETLRVEARATLQHWESTA